ncbi:MAG TPA: SDR family NAD(P)-dependent oxidoreductase [Candidatus Binatia bacterium]|jgi:NAD(P)-dependent dehydrogenase (short-subunit alcohol dehydrogenase family)
MKEFRGKNAVITGGASGIGLAIANVLAREGARIVIADVEQGALDRAVAGLRSGGADAIGVRTDVSSFESMQALEKAAVAAFGNVHVFVGNAGVGAHEDVSIWDLPLSDWRWCMAVNVWGIVHGIKAFVPGMIAHGEEGHVVHTSSGNGGLVLVPTTPIYSATKAAVSAITESLHLQLAMQGAKIHAHVLYPGPHIVSSNIFTAARNRPDQFRRETEQVAPPVTLESLGQIFEAMGRKLETTSPAEVAQHALAGLREDRFYILPWNDEGMKRFRARIDGICELRNPEPRFF